MTRVGGHNFHPSRVKGSVKFTRNLAVQREIEKNKKKDTFKPVDMSQPDWSRKI